MDVFVSLCMFVRFDGNGDISAGKHHHCLCFTPTTRPPPMQPPKTTLFAWPSSLMRTAEGGGGPLFLFVPMCWELLLHFNHRTQQYNTTAAVSASFFFSISVIPELFFCVLWRAVPTFHSTTPGRRSENFKPSLQPSTTTTTSCCCCCCGGDDELSPSFCTFFERTFEFKFFFCRGEPRERTAHPPTSIMTRRSCAIYATGIVCAHLLIVGIALVVAQVFQTMIHSRLKKVSLISVFSTFHFSLSVTSEVVFTV